MTYTTLRINTIAAVRCDADKQVNKIGRRLMEICPSLNLIIMDGRFGKYKQIFDKTSSETSTVDYIIISTNFVEYSRCSRFCSYIE